MRGEFRQAEARNERDYEEAASAMAAKRELSPAEAEEVGRLWRKLVKLYHPDRFASEPEKLETYHRLSSAINEARDAGDVATLREIANDPDGFLLRRGWGRLDFGDERRVAELHRLWQSLEMEIVRVLEATNRLHESAEWELAGLVEKQPEMLDVVVARQVVGLEAEIGKLTSEADVLAREIGELAGSGAVVL